MKKGYRELPEGLRAWFCACKASCSPTSASPDPAPSPLSNSSFSTDRSKAIPLLQFSFVCVSMVSYVAFCVVHICSSLSFFWCLGRSVLCDENFLGISLIFFFLNMADTLPSVSTLRKHAYSNTLKILPPKNGNFSDKKFWYFSYFCSKHRLSVLVRTASSRRF